MSYLKTILWWITPGYAVTGRVRHSESLTRNIWPFNCGLIRNHGVHPHSGQCLWENIQSLSICHQCNHFLSAETLKKAISWDWLMFPWLGLSWDTKWLIWQNNSNVLVIWQHPKESTIPPVYTYFNIMVSSMLLHMFFVQETSRAWIIYHLFLMEAFILCFYLGASDEVFACDRLLAKHSCFLDHL
jgi:hypothetical protein